jgi:hypothetical protein
MKRKMKRFDDGGYTGDDPIVKYRMGKLSEADTYDALGQKDLADASRAKEPKAAPKTAPTLAPSVVKDEVIDMRDNKNNTVGDDTRQRALEFVKNPPKVTTPKAVTAPKAVTTSKTVVKEQEVKDSPKYIASRDMAESNARDAEEKKKTAKISSKSEDNTKESTTDKKLSAEDIARVQREAITGKKDTNLKMPESKSFTKNLREAAGIRSYKVGGTVKRSSASKRGDGIATKGHTRGKYC